MNRYRRSGLTQATTPYGHLRWSYQANSLAGSRAFREVQSRFLLQSSTGSETGISIYRDSGDTNRSVHLYANFFDWTEFSGDPISWACNPSSGAFARFTQKIGVSLVLPSITAER